MRLFVAVRPPAPVLDHLDLALRVVQAHEALTADPADVRWTLEENRHVTAAFYGTLPDGRTDELVAALEDGVRAIPPFELRLRGAGVFAHRTLWVGVAGDLGSMRRLSAMAGAAGEEVGARPDDRVRSRPHLTVGRVGAPTPAGRGRRRRDRPTDDPAASLVRALAVYDGPEWTVEELLLVASAPGAGRGGGPLYTPVQAFALGA
ncbi:RNA 2',3'-cyclic phosphodiesterase [Cellulomonas sp. P22]|uniref:RNA 2',3'-cyclic phosphodiesterase n=1 Tax=Cellulomonas sp. P22 TaxID=3373189 RepID=UPI0037BB448A